jgi:hypothetical protein
VPIQNIEGSQTAMFSIALVASKTTTFAQNCTYNLGGTTGSCASAPISADESFTAQGFAYSGTYPSTSLTGFTTSGNVMKGQLCMTDILSADQLLQLPVCAITTVNSATSVTNSYWNIEGYNYTGGILGFGPGNTQFW